jgi:4-hydroxybenzoate polyprenyltransferase
MGLILLKSLKMNWKTVNNLLMFEQTLFGLPWALIGAIIPFANPSFKSPDMFVWFWILSAFIFARTAGMSFNRLFDHYIDLKNPRTAKRPLPAGEISRGQVSFIAWFSLIFFTISCYNINTLCFLFSPVVAFLIFAYSFTKRFTFYCHFVLGLIEFFAPFLGYIAITSQLSLIPVFLGFAILFWISGMDIMYCTQDEAYDKENGLFSMAVKLGVKGCFRLARLLHILVVICLLVSGILAQMTFLYYVGLFFVALLFLYQHSVVKNQLHKAFFVANSLIAITQFIFTLGAVLWGVLL